jgi:2-haloacid dehalogenase
MLAHWCVKGHGVAEILVFDLYGTLVDPLAIAADLTEVLGADGSEVSRQWRPKQLEYSFRLTVMDSYLDFRAVTGAALEFALASAGISLTSAQRGHLVERYDHLPPLADAAPAQRALAQCGFELVVLSNGTPDMIAACLASSGLDACISQQLSADDVHAYKPSAGVYLYAAQRLGGPARQLRLVSGNAFDIVGAGAAGLRTAWVNRAARRLTPSARRRTSSSPTSANCRKPWPADPAGRRHGSAARPD